MSLTVVDHPVIHDRLTRMRHRDTAPEAFRAAVHQISLMLAYEAARMLPVRETDTPTPLVAAKTKVVGLPKEKPI